MKKLLIGVVIIGITFAQTPKQIELLLEKNREIQAAKNNYLSALEKIKIAGSLPDPRFESTLGITPIETRNGPIETQLMLVQKLPLWGKIRLIRASETASSEIAKQGLIIAENNIVFKLRKNLADFHRANNSLQILKEYSIELESFLRSVETQYSNGIGLTRHPVIKLKIEITKIENQINSLQSKLENLNQELQALYDNNLPNDILENTNNLIIGNLDEKYWLDHVIQNNPQLLSKAHQLEKSTIDKEYVKRKVLPDLTAGLTYSLIGDSDISSNPTAGDDAFGLKFGINLPIWFRKNKAQIQIANHDIRQQKDEQADLINNFEAEVKSLLNDINSINISYEIYRSSILQEIEMLQSSSISAYENGLVSFIYLLDSYKTMFNAQLEFESIKSERNILFAKLYQLAGIIYPEGAYYEN